MAEEDENMDTSEPLDLSCRKPLDQEPEASGNRFNISNLGSSLGDVVDLHQDPVTALEIPNDAAATKTGIHVNQCSHYMYYFDGDEDAATTDPEVMKTNYRIPMRYLIEKKEGDNSFIKITEPSLKDEFIISHRFLRSFKTLKAWECVEDLQKFRGWNRVITNPLPVIKRIRDYSLPVTGCNVRNLIASLERSSKESSLSGGTEGSSTESSPLNELKTSSHTINNQDRENTESKTKSGGKHTPPEELVVASVGPFDVMLRSLQFLKPRTGLNDEIVDYGLLKVIKSCDSPSDLIYIPTFRWQSFFYSGNCDGKVDVFYKWLMGEVQGRNLLDFKTMVVPICKDDFWILAVICNPFPKQEVIEDAERLAREKKLPLNVYSLTIYHNWLYGKGSRDPVKILLFDSMREYFLVNCANYHEYIDDAAKYIRKGLLAIHRKLWRETQRDIMVHPKFALMIDYHSLYIPGQFSMDEKDGGLFIMRYLKYWLDEMERLKGDYMCYYARDFTKLYNEKYKGYVTRNMIYEIILNWCKRYKPHLEKKVLTMKPS